MLIINSNRHKNYNMSPANLLLYTSVKVQIVAKRVNICKQSDEEHLAFQALSSLYPLFMMASLPAFN